MQDNNQTRGMFKYHQHITSLKECEIQCPPSEVFPSNMDAFRFYHNVSCENNWKNHKPVGIINPTRKLDNTEKCDSLAVLSCFESKDQAEAFIRNSLNKNITKSIGCNLGKFKITESDGLRTNSDEKGHFDFFEFEGFDFKSHQIEEYLIKQCNQ